MMDDLPLSPRARGAHGGVPDGSAVCIDERDEVGRFLRVTRPVRRGEALLVEDPLFLSPANDEELQTLLSEMCDLNAVAAASAMGGLSSASSACPTFSSGSGPTSATWLPVPSQLCLVAAKALVFTPASPECEELRMLQGDPERWVGPARHLWSLLREDLRPSIAIELLCEVYAIISANSHAAEDGRAGLFSAGSLAEHSCAPSAFKEVFAPVENISRPGTPTSPHCPPEAGFSTPPGSPAHQMLSSASILCRRPQLVIRALHDLDEDEIVSIGYVPEYLPTFTRRELLQSGYGFFCMCDRCARESEVCCAFICPSCGDGPCSPTAPVMSTDIMAFRSLTFRCEACGGMLSEDPRIDDFFEAEVAEVVSAESTRVLHPFHHKIFRMYLHNLKAMPPADRLQAIDQISEAHRRLSGSDGHPLLGRLFELTASAHCELGDVQRAASSYQRAADLYELSHRGPPESGHDRRCYDNKMSLTAGRLGSVPRRLSRHISMTRSPSLPSLAEGFEGD